MIQLMLEDKLIKSNFDNLQQWLNNADETNHLSEKTYAVAINQNFVPKSEYCNTQLNDHDHVQIFFPIQGG